MLRTALKPRWLALLALVVAVIVSFTFLGLWQLNVARDRAAQERAERIATLPIAPLDDVAAPHQPLLVDAVGRTVMATGRYDASQQVLVAGRRLEGRVGYWVLTPLVVETTGARLGVVRGFVADPAAAPAPPSGRVDVRGALASPEAAPDDDTPLPPGQVATIDLADLVNDWDADIYTAFAFAVAEQGPGGSAVPVPTSLQRIPPPSPADTEFAWRNLAYALQWWLFAAFALYMWWRMVRDDAHADRAAEAADTDRAADENAEVAGPGGAGRPLAPAPAPPEPAPDDTPTVTGGTPR